MAQSPVRNRQAHGAERWVMSSELREMRECDPSPFIAHNFLPGPIGLWSKVVYYIGNRVPFRIERTGVLLGYAVL